MLDAARSEIRGSARGASVVIGWFAWYGFHPKTKVWGERERTSSPRRGDPSVTIVEHRGSWGDLTGVGPGGEIADAGSFYLISGMLRNDSGRALPYVKLGYELLDDSGEVVFREYGYNRRAEGLRDEAFEKGEKPLHEMGIEALPPSGTDGFRTFFFRDEIPPFAKYRVLVEEVRDASRRVASGSGAEGSGKR